MRILFVCWGNICRSPLAHGVANELRKRYNSSMQFDSCGMYGEPENEPTHPGSQEIIKDKLGISFSKLSRHWRGSDYDDFDLILCMDEKNFEDVMAEINHKDPLNKVRMFRDYDPASRGEVPDPYYQGGFDRVYEIVYRTIDNLFLLEQKNELY